MFNGQYKSINSILSDILKYPFVEGISEEDIALYLSDYLRIIGAPIAFDNLTKDLEVKNYRASLPKDMIYIRGVRYNDCLDENKDVYVPMVYASDIYHSGVHCNDTIPEETRFNTTLTYNINANYIETSEKEGYVQLAYQALRTDETGLPMIPDDTKVMMGLKYFILWQYAEPAYYRKDVPRDIFSDIKQQYYWYVGAAQNSLNMPSPDQMKTLENGLIRLIKSSTQHENAWKNFSNKEVFNFNSRTTRTHL